MKSGNLSFIDVEHKGLTGQPSAHVRQVSGQASLS